MSIDWSGIPARRLPLYILANASESMRGTKIAELNHGIQTLCQDLMSDPRSADTVWISIIQFADSAYQLELTPITQFIPPVVAAGGGRALGSALHLLNESLDHDVIANEPGRRGDYRPLVLLLMDGQPTDVWGLEAAKLKTRITAKPAGIIGLAIGADVDLEIMRKFCHTALKMQDVTGDNLRAFFRWTSQPVTNTTLHTSPALPIPAFGISTVSVPTKTLFVSYSRRDSAFVQGLIHDLKAAGLQIWLDHERLQIGTPDWEQAIRQAIAQSDGMVYVASENAQKSVNVQHELAIARDAGKAIFPLWARGDHWSNCVPFGFINLQYADGRGERYPNAVGELIRAINQE